MVYSNHMRSNSERYLCPIYLHGLQKLIQDAVPNIQTFVHLRHPGAPCTLTYNVHFKLRNFGERLFPILHIQWPFIPSPIDITLFPCFTDKNKSPLSCMVFDFHLKLPTASSFHSSHFLAKHFGWLSYLGPIT